MIPANCYHVLSKTPAAVQPMVHQWLTHIRSHHTGRQRGRRITKRFSTGQSRALFERLHIDLPLLIGGFWLCTMVMYSASGQSHGDDGSSGHAHGFGTNRYRIGFSPDYRQRTHESLAPALFCRRYLLLGVLFSRILRAQRWLNLGLYVSSHRNCSNWQFH